ncbi:hypothetical protein [Nicoliella lavandulae]|uniref:Uncharacterized protein n=1 Tax=Nicoliella lavandulae TaxID=3082954 RepID=A0ABU8SM13_9LACO
MKKQIIATALVAGVLSPLFAVNHVANASTTATLKTSVTYNDGKINFKGSASNKDVKKVVIKYGSKSFSTASLKSKKFSIAKEFTGKGTFHVYGTTKAGKKITKSYSVTKSQYVTKTPSYYTIDRTKSDGAVFRILTNGEKNYNYRVFFNGTKIIDSNGNKENFEFTLKSLPDTYNLTVQVTAKNKEIAPTLTLPQVANGKGLTNPELFPY